MERMSNGRAWVLLGLFGLVLVWFSWTLFHLQIIETDGNTDNTTTYSSITRVKAARGDILDRNGVKMVGNRASYDLVFNHYVIISSDNTNESLLKLVKKCRELGIEYNDHFPMTKERPFEYTLDEYQAAWRGYIQKFVGDGWMDLDSDIAAPLLIQHLRDSYDIPDEWPEEDARAVIGLRYELDLRNVTNISTYVFIEDISDEHLAILLELNIPGLMVESSTVREYYTTYAAHILGYMGAMDEAEWAEFQKKGYAMDAHVGQSGFEEAFEDQLHAIDGTRLDVVDKDGTIISQTYTKIYDEDGNVIGENAPRAGNNVETTIDLSLQMVAEDSLAEIMDYLTDPEQNSPEKGKYEGLDAEGAAVIVMEVATGDVLVCASYPTFDLANMKKADVYAQILETPFDPMYNRAFSAAYAPGSTYKPVTLVAAMNLGLLNSETEIEDKGIWTRYEGFSPTCLVWSSNRVTHQWINGANALEVSCNYFFYELGYLIRESGHFMDLDATAKGFGLGEPTGIELEETSKSHRSNKEAKAAEYSGLDAQWFKGDEILTCIGQAENRFTPMQLAVYASTLANRGTRMKATFLNRVVSADYRSLVLENEPEVASTMEICNDAYISYMEGMRRVITGTLGTARKYFDGRDNARFRWPKDIIVYAKTGTAQTFKNVSDHGSFICFAGREGQTPEIAIAIYGEKVAHGATLAVVAEDIILAYFAKGEASDVPSYENRLN